MVGFTLPFDFHFDPAILTSSHAIVCAGVGGLSYLALVGALRNWRRDRVHRKYQAKFDAGELTPRDAQEIVHVFGYYDMPSLLSYSLSFALFKTYAIPSISKLLAATKQLSSDETVSKRYADTEILIGTWMSCPISGFTAPGEKGLQATSEKDDPRGMIALARVNWLHSRYDIKNDDYLYTLSLFVLEPIKWIQKYGWRSLSPLEQHANFLLWAEIGRRMNISGIPDTLDELRTWSAAYEEKHMVPAPSNHAVAQYTTEEILFAVPEALGIKAFLRRVVNCLLEDRVRTAMLQPEEPAWLRRSVDTTIHTLMFFVRFFCLPRRKYNIAVNLDEPPASGRMRPNWFQARPWYKPHRGGVFALVDRLRVAAGMSKDVPGPQYRCEGYRLEQLGPLNYENKGHEEVMKMAEKLHGCPIRPPYALPASTHDREEDAKDR